METMVFQKHEWTKKPLKQLVEVRVFNYFLQREEKEVVFQMTKEGYEKKDVNKYKKKLAHTFVQRNRHDIRVMLEGEGTRSVSSIDQMVREQHYASSQWGINLPIEVKEPKVLHNVKLLYFGTFPKVTVKCKEGQKRNKAEALMKPAYELISNRAKKGLPRPIILIKEGKRKEVQYNPEDYDNRPLIVVNDEKEGKMIVRGKNQEMAEEEHVYQHDSELRNPETIEDFAVELVSIDSRYGGDVAQATKDLENYYYNHKQVVIDLRSWYLMHVDKAQVSFETFKDKVREMREESPLYTFKDILEEIVEQ